MGGVTNADARNAEISCDFLESGVKYMDGLTAHYEKNPESYIITTFELSKNDIVPVRMAPGGGFAMSIKRKVD